MASAAVDKKLQDLTASIPSRAASTKTIVGQLGTWLQRYRGGMPLGFLAAICQFESGGKMVAGDPNLGEYGFFQVAASTPTSFGYAAATRTDAEANVFFGGLEYNIEAVKMAMADSRVSLGTEQSWKLARLAFAIGSGGTKTLLKNSAGLGSDPWAAIKSYMAQTGGVPLGGQSADTVFTRVHAVDIVWQVGQLAYPSSPGIPSIPPPPPTLGPPTVQAPILARIAGARTAQMLALAGIIGLASWWFYFRKR